MRIEGHTIPHDDKLKTNGEDGYFILHANNATYLCVFDGVGGWAKQEVNVKDFVNEMIENCKISIRKGHLNPEIIIEDALNHASLAGSVTVIMAIIQEKEMKIYQIGDSGMVISNNNRIIFETDEQQHSFNFPYQIGKNGSGGFHGDSPNEGLFYRIQMTKGDTIILGSDGLFDNLNNSDIMNNDESAKELCREAYRNSKQKIRTVPFYQRAYNEGVINHLKQGGKEDDITAIIVYN
jgi:protein phosphatase PTC7